MRQQKLLTVTVDKKRGRTVTHWLGHLVREKWVPVQFNLRQNKYVEFKTLEGHLHP